MELEKFVENFADQFDDTDPAQIKSTTRFHDLEEWSSLTALSIIVGIIILAVIIPMFGMYEQIE